MKFILKAFLYFISYLPIKVVWALAFGFGFLMNYVFQYRKEVILTNLSNSFPGKSQQENQTLKKSYYYHSTRILLESFKLFSYSNKQLHNFIDGNFESDLKKLVSEPKGAVIMTGHLGNFEMGGQLFSTFVKLPVFFTYRRFSSKNWENLMIQMRSKFNAQPIQSNQIIRKAFEHKDTGMFITFMNDQAPLSEKDFEWFTFLNQETAFFMAPAKIAQKFNLPVYFLGMHRKENQKYTIDAQLITSNPQKTTVKEITAQYAKILEQYISKYPEAWLWSHKRWKRKRENINKNYRNI